MTNPSKIVPLDTSRLTGKAAPDTTVPANAAPVDVPDTGSLEDRVIAVLRTCYDPELPVDVYELGLIYGLKVEDGAVHVRMTLTSPACPVAGALPQEIENKVRAVPGVKSAKVELVWDPPWDHSRLSEAAQLKLGLF
jgi:FeS assembly SUF system protein